MLRVFSLIESWSNSLQTTQVSCETRISILTNAKKSS
nr:MAG TPA: hypothetical protein [Bacteriophage sp.]